MAYQTIPESDGGFDTWGITQRRTLRNGAPNLNTFYELKVGFYGLGTNLATSAVNAGTMEGGSVVGAAAAAFQSYGVPIFQTPNTTSFGFSFRGKLAVPAGGRIAQIGIANAAGTHAVVVATDNAVSATDFLLQIIGGATTTVLSGTANANVHDFAITGDATTVRLWIDGAVAGSTTTLTNLADEPFIPANKATTADEAQVARFMYGVIGP